MVDPDRKRIALTAKKTLVESDLPVIARLDDAQAGTVTHAVVFKVLDNALLVEFYNNLTAQVPLREVRYVVLYYSTSSPMTTPSEPPPTNLGEAFPVGKPVKVRILNVDRESGRMLASIRQASSKAAEVINVHGVQVGETVHGSIQATHKDHAVVKLEPTCITALLSLNNLANNCDTTAAQLRSTLMVGERLDDLIVLTQDPDKGIVIVNKRSKWNTHEALPGNEGVSAKTVEVGQVLSARVTGRGRGGNTLYITDTLKGSLHPTDTCDDYQDGTPFPIPGTVVECVVLSVDSSRQHVVVSTRPSRLRPTVSTPVKDREISNVDELKVGETVRGFVKNIVEHGLFISLGRSVDARVQIKELFDAVGLPMSPLFGFTLTGF